MTSFLIESWLWYAIVMTVVLLRFVSRLLHYKSILRFQIEDYLMLYVVCAYTVFVILINITTHTNTNLIDPHDAMNLDEQDRHERVIGSKIILGVETTMNMVQWGTKACLLLLYHRITENLVQHMFVKIVGAYVAVTYIVMESLYLGYWCRPFSDYWAVPTPNIQCSTAIHHLITNLTFNLTSDLLIMSIPLPLLVRAHLEIKRKILLCLPFSLGIFSIICAILSKHVSFTQPFSPVWVFWYIREASCVMIVANMPYIWGLARRVFKIESFWGRGSTHRGIDGVYDDETRDTGMEIAGGEIREIQGIEPLAETTSGNQEKKSGGQGWKRLSNLFKDNKTIKRPPPAIIIETKDVSITTSAADTHSDTSVPPEAWKNIDWSKRRGDTQMAQLSSSQSGISTGSPAAPRTVLHSSSIRRISTLGSQRSSAFTSRRHTQASLSEVTRQTTRNTGNLDAVDRLYRLDDEALVADVEAARPHSDAGGFD